MQDALFHECINDAIGSVIAGLGGFKKVGPMLRPEVSIETAANWLRDCLNHDRRERLHPEQLLLIARECRRIGNHAIALYLARDCGYSDPLPVEPEDEKASLMREFNKNAELKHH